MARHTRYRERGSSLPLNAVHHPNRQIIRVQQRPLLDVYLTVAKQVVALASTGYGCLRITTKCPDSLPQCHPILVGQGERFRRECACEGAAAEIRRMEPKAFFVRK